MVCSVRRILAVAGFLALSYLPYLAPRRAAGLPGLTIYWTIWCSTEIILCDAACNHLGGPSLLIEITRTKRKFLAFLVTGAVSGLCLDGSAQWLCKLWIYPYWTPIVYGWSFVIGFCAYWMAVCEAYFLARSLLGLRFARVRRWQPRQMRITNAVAGLGMTAAGLVLARVAYRRAGGYRVALTAFSSVHAPFYIFVVIWTGIWLLLEFVISRQGKTSLRDSLRHRNWLPFGAILASGWGLGFLMETANAAQHFWTYTNWPLQNVTLCGVPILVLLIWPLQSVVFLSIGCAFGAGSAFE